MKVNYVSVSSDKLRTGIAAAGLSLEEASIKVCCQNKDYFASCLRSAKNGKCKLREERFIKICELCDLDPNDLRVRLKKKSPTVTGYDQIELPLTEEKPTESAPITELELRINLTDGIITALDRVTCYLRNYREGLKNLKEVENGTDKAQNDTD